MEFLGVGPTEFLLIIVIALIVLGPKDLVKTGKTIGKWLNDIVQSDTWKAVKQTSQELKQLPTKLMREDNFERHLTEEGQPSATTTNAGTWTGKMGTANASPQADLSAGAANTNTIHPPITVDGPPAPTHEPAQKKTAATPRKKAAPLKRKVVKPEKKPASRKKSNA